MAEAPASIREVAAPAGVSVGTVSNVLNRPDIVAEPTRSRVRDAIKQLGFIRNESARQLRAGRSRKPRSPGKPAPPAPGTPLRPRDCHDCHNHDTHLS